MGSSLEQLLCSAAPMKANGDTAAVASLPFLETVASAFEQFRDSLYRHVLLLTWNAGDSEEIVQEGFLKLHLHLLQGKRIDNVRAWLFRVTHNSAIDRGRTARDVESLSESSHARTAEGLLAGQVPSPETILLKNEQHLLLAKAIDNLPELQRHCLYLRKEGLSYRDIASVLSIGETTVVDNLTRAIVRLNREVQCSGR